MGGWDSNKNTASSQKKNFMFLIALFLMYCGKLCDWQLGRRKFLKIKKISDLNNFHEHAS